MLRRLARAVLPDRLIGRLRAWRIRRMIAGFHPRVVRHTYGTGPLSVYLSDPLAVGWYDQDWPDLPEVARLRRTQLRPGATVFDVGAHQGVVALMLAREVGPAGRVIAVEPNPHNADAAEKNRDLNGMPWVSVVRAAASDRPGRLTFNLGLNGQIDDGSGAWGRMDVEAVTIDGLAERFGPPDVLFVDVEGAECRALAGAAGVLRRRPDCFIEVHVGTGLELLGGSVAEVFAFFPEADYECLGRSEADTDFRPIRPDDPITADRFFLLALARRPTDPP